MKWYHLNSSLTDKDSRNSHTISNINGYLFVCQKFDVKLLAVGCCPVTLSGSYSRYTGTEQSHTQQAEKHTVCVTAVSDSATTARMQISENMEQQT